MKPRLLVLLAVLGLTGWFCGPMLLGSRLPAYRDTADFYYPLFRFERDEWRAGRVPLWNPYSNLGMPLAATGTASTFYPGKLLFHLPLDYDTAFRLYLVGHLLLAAGSAYRLARCCSASVTAAGVAAISYAFCGNVLFQHANIVFLMSAAWLPLAVEAALRMFRGRSLRWAAALGAVMALMILGGDPQAAYHAGLLAAAGALFIAGGVQRVSSGPQPGGVRRARWSGRWGSLGLLSVAAGVAFMLAAVQILPSAEMTARSDRAATGTARSLYEIPAALGRDQRQSPIVAGLLCRLEAGTHHERAYRYSLAPWRLTEYVWPNSSGRQFPIHRRWLDAADGENLVWVPSLYMGLLPLVLALAAFGLRRGDPLRAWFSWIVLAALLASFGRFGLGWLASRFSADAGLYVGDPFGGLYWLMTVVLPGYIDFRYPAKLLVVAALGLSVLAALGWDRVQQADRPRLRRSLVGLAAISLLGLLVFWALRPCWFNWLAGAEPDPLFGPLDADGAAHDVLGALGQTALMALASYWLVRRAASGSRWLGPAVLGMVAIDLAVANSWLVPTERPDAAALLVASDAGRLPPRAFRHSTWVPDAWSALSAPDRLAELARWNRQTAAPHHHLTQRLALVEVTGTMDLEDYVQLIAAANPERERGHALLDLVGAERVIAPDPGSKPGHIASLLGVRFADNPSRLPRAWIVHDVVRLPAIRDNDSAAIARRSVEVLQPAGRTRDFRRQAVVESGLPLPRESAGATAAFGEACRVAHYDPLRVEIEAELATPGLVVLSDQFYPGWRLSVSTDGRPPRDVPILRTNRVMRGVWLPAGRCQLLYQYRPSSVVFGGLLSAVGTMLIGLLIWPGRAVLKSAFPGGLARPLDDGPPGKAKGAAEGR